MQRPLRPTEIDSLAPNRTAGNQTIFQKGRAGFHCSNRAHFLESSPTEDLMVFVRTNKRKIPVFGLASHSFGSRIICGLHCYQPIPDYCLLPLNQSLRRLLLPGCPLPVHPSCYLNRHTFPRSPLTKFSFLGLTVEVPPACPRQHSFSGPPVPVPSAFTNHVHVLPHLWAYVCTIPSSWKALPSLTCLENSYSSFKAR